jgi:hypothetical protein
MAVLYVRNVPDELYEALHKQARKNRRSIAAEVQTILEQNAPTARELRRRRGSFRRLLRLGSTPSPCPGPLPSSEEMVREDREG